MRCEAGDRGGVVLVELDQEGFELWQSGRADPVDPAVERSAMSWANSRTGCARRLDRCYRLEAEGMPP